MDKEKYDAPTTRTPDQVIEDGYRYAIAGEPRKQSMLYEICPTCNGTGQCQHCKTLNVIETGATAGQLKYMAELDVLRQEAGISAAMLRDGRARELMLEVDQLRVQLVEAVQGYCAAGVHVYLDALRMRVQVLESAIRSHRSQKAGDRCIEDDDRLYEALGDGIKCDRRVGDKAAMLKDCERFIDRRCEGGHWPTYATIESALQRIAKWRCRCLDYGTGPCAPCIAREAMAERVTGSTGST